MNHQFDALPEYKQLQQMQKYTTNLKSEKA